MLQEFSLSKQFTLLIQSHIFGKKLQTDSALDFPSFLLHLKPLPRPLDRQDLIFMLSPLKTQALARQPRRQLSLTFRENYEISYTSLLSMVYILLATRLENQHHSLVSVITGEMDSKLRLTLSHKSTVKSVRNSPHSHNISSSTQN